MKQIRKETKKEKNTWLKYKLKNNKKCIALKNYY